MNEFKMSLFLPPISPVKNDATGRTIQPPTSKAYKGIALQEVCELITQNEQLKTQAEAVYMTGTDIAPTYIEDVQLAFTIANDCGEAGRNDFRSLCSLSTKYDGKNTQALFSNALHADKEDIHLGIVFHLAEQCGVKISAHAHYPKAGTVGTALNFSHTRAT